MPWVVVGVAAASAVVAFGLGAMVGSDGGGDELMSDDVPDVVDEWGDAFEAGDPSALAVLYADSGEFNCRAFDFTIGSSAISTVVMGDETEFTEFSPTTVLVGDEIIAVGYSVRAQSPSGEDVSTSLIAVFDLDEAGLIARSTIDYDRREMFPDAFPDSSEQGLTGLGCPAGA